MRTYALRNPKTGEISHRTPKEILHSIIEAMSDEQAEECFLNTLQNKETAEA